MVNRVGGFVKVTGSRAGAIPRRWLPASQPGKHVLKVVPRLWVSPTSLPAAQKRWDRRQHSRLVCVALGPGGV